MSVALLASCALALLLPATPAQAAAPGLKASLGAVVPGEATTLSGKLAKGVRPVVLQAKVGKKWKKVAGKKTTKAGAFAFAVKPRAVTTYRVFAKKAKVAGKKRPAVTTKAVRITMAKQAALAYTLPGIAAYGTTPQSSASAQVVVTSRFVPVRPGRPVALQVRASNGWSTIATSTQNTYGSAAFKLNSIPSATTRAVALAYRGAPAFAGVVAQKAWRIDYVTEFNGTSLPEKWFYRLKDQWPGGLRQCSRSTADAVVIDGGVAKLLAVKDAVNQRDSKTCPYGTYRNGHISTTYETYAFNNGIAAARVKFQEGGGQHAAFWLQSQSGNQGAEIDVAEYFGRGRSDYGLTQFIHYKNAKGQGLTSGSIADKAYQARTRQALGAAADDWWKAFHVFSVEWSPSAYIFRIDGVETFRTNQGLTNRQAVLILSALTSDWELPNFSGTGERNTTTVDWVKTWKTS